MMTRVLTLILLFLCYILELSAQTTSNPTSTSYYQWPSPIGPYMTETLHLQRRCFRHAWLSLVVAEPQDYQTLLQVKYLDLGKIYRKN